MTEVTAQEAMQEAGETNSTDTKKSRILGNYTADRRLKSPLYPSPFSTAVLKAMISLLNL